MEDDVVPLETGLQLGKVRVGQEIPREQRECLGVLDGQVHGFVGDHLGVVETEPLEEVRELADIAGPVPPAEPLEGSTRDFGRRALSPGKELRGESIEVFGSVPQGGTSSTTPRMRWYRSSRNRFSRTSSSRSREVEKRNLTSMERSSSAPTGRILRDERTRSSLD
jgi:hypothetical protein